MKPRGTRYSVLPLVARTTRSPSPTCGTSEYTTHRPSFEMAGEEIERQ